MPPSCCSVSIKAGRHQAHPKATLSLIPKKNLTHLQHYPSLSYHQHLGSPHFVSDLSVVPLTVRYHAECGRRAREISPPTLHEE
jgi:hypothetical protein